MAQTINVDSKPALFMPTLYYSQGDVGRTFEIVVSSSDGFTIPSGATCQMVATKPSGLGFTVAGTVSGNKVTFTTTAVMTDEWGRFPAELRITSGNTVIGTANFYMEGERNPHPDGTTDGQQEQLIPELTLLVERAENAAQTATDDAIEAASATIDEVLNYLPTEVTNLKSEISDITEATRNIFDKSNSGLRLDELYVTAQGQVASNANVKSIYCLCKPNTTYTISKVVTSSFRVADFANKPVLLAYAVSPPITSNAAKSITFTTGATASYLMVYLFDSGYDSDFDAVLASVQIEEGDTATEHEPFRSAVDVVARSKRMSTADIEDKAITPIKTSFINHVDGTNFISGWVNDTYIDTGIETPYTGFYSSTPVWLEENTSYYWSDLYSGYYAFYDKDDRVLEYHNINDAPSNPFTTPAGTAYGRFTVVNNAQKRDAWINTVNQVPDAYAEQIDEQYLPMNNGEYCDYLGKDFSIFNKCLCIGDSTTYGVFNYKDGQPTTQGYESFPLTYSYPVYLHKISNVECTNMGEASATIDEWWSHHSSADLSGHDVAVVALGINDKYRYGGWTQTAETALGNIVSALQSANNNIKIFVCTIIPIYTGEDFDEISQGIEDFVSTLNDSNVLLLDLKTHSKMTESQAYDNGHPSAYGYLRMAQDINNYIGYLMNNSKIAYRNVQFIGTEHTY